jgi:hypothetical protein
MFISTMVDLNNHILCTLVICLVFYFVLFHMMFLQQQVTQHPIIIRTFFGGVGGRWVVINTWKNLFLAFTNCGNIIEWRVSREANSRGCIQKKCLKNIKA